MTCRCRDLRRALLGLVRAAKRENKAVRPVVELDRNSSYQVRAQAFDCLIESSKSLSLSLRRARRLLRETRPETQCEVIDPDLAVMAPGDIAAKLEALNRIMATWQSFDLVCNDPCSRGALDDMLKVLRSVAREFGFGGEDGGAG